MYAPLRAPRILPLDEGVPNETFVNYRAMAREQGVIIHTRLTIGYDGLWREVHALLTRAALATE